MRNILAHKLRSWSLFWLSSPLCLISVASTSWLNRRTIMHQPAVKCVGGRHQLSLDKLDRRQHHVFVPLSWISWNFEVRQLHSNLPIIKEQDEMRHTGYAPNSSYGNFWVSLHFILFLIRIQIRNQTENTTNKNWSLCIHTVSLWGL